MMMLFNLFYYILLTVRSLREFDNRCNIPKKCFTDPGIMQSMEPIIIVHTLSLIDPLKAIGMAFCFGFCGLDIGC